LNSIEFIELNLDYFAKFGANSLTDTQIQIEKGQLGKQKNPNTYVPFRNANLIAIATSYCESRNCDAVAIGVQSGDHIGYPDCTPNFIESMQYVIDIGTQTDKQIKLLAPFVNMNKTDILRIGMQLGVPYEYTWSCYDTEDTACGLCNSCLSRLKAFNDLGLIDPIKYSKKE
ncbi:MAG TPA: 7-cyano-7-deazaguanine synthase, partial [Methanocorpusculum sp.]|nr:7-cyano-7-deazaguanine synthase [Methanocorpusculum sp.]